MNRSIGHFEIHPWVRGMAALLAVVATMTVTSLAGAGAVWLAVMLPLAAVAGVIRKHLKFVLTFVLPISCALVVVWWGIVGAPPGSARGSAPGAGALYAGLVSIRLALLGGVTHLCLTTIRPERLVATLKAWGLKGELLVIAVSSMTLAQEMRLRGEQVLTARYARGFVARRSLITDLLQLPFVLRPMLAWVLRAAIQRGEVWQQRGLVERMSVTPPADVQYSVVAGGIYLSLAVCWFLFAIATRLA